MAYYDALIAKWAILTPGTTANKLAQVNAATTTGSVPTTFFTTGAAILNCIDWAEFNALTPVQRQTNLLQMCAIQGGLLGGSGQTSHLVAGMIIAYFPGGGATITALTALAQATTQPWWQANGYPRAFDLGDIAAAGLS